MLRKLSLSLVALLLLSSVALGKKKAKEETADEEEEEVDDAPKGYKTTPDFPWKKPMKIIDGDDLEETIAKGRSIIMFYAPWCGHCQQAKEAYQDAASEDTEKDHTYAAMNCDENQQFCWDLELKGYPTFKVYVDGEIAEEQLGMKTKNWYMKALKKADPSKMKKKEKKEKKEKKKADDEL